MPAEAHFDVLVSGCIDGDRARRLDLVGERLAVVGDAKGHAVGAVGLSRVRLAVAARPFTAAGRQSILH